MLRTPILRRTSKPAADIPRSAGRRAPRHLAYAEAGASCTANDESGDCRRLGDRCAAGAMWTVFCAAAGRIMVLGGNIALAYFLVPGEMGLAALAFSIISVASFFSSNSLLNVLIQRPENFNRNAGDVFWLSLVLHTAASVMLLLMTPLLGLFSQEPDIVALVMIHAVSCPIGALATVYTAVLLRDLRYQTVAGIRLLDVFINTAGAILLAANGFGAYSLIIPVLVRVVMQAILTRMAAGRIAITRPRPHRWPALLLPSFWLMLNVMFASVYYYGTSFAIGLVCDTAVIGIFFWGFLVSSQALNFLSTNLKDVLFPTLLRLNGDSQRQYRGYCQASRALLLVVAPTCLLQALLAGPLVEMVFPARWLPAVGVIQWLSVGMISQPLGVLAISLLMARGRFRTIALVTGVQTAVVLAAAMAGACWNSATWIAAFTGSCFFLGNLTVGWVGFRQFSHGWTELSRTIAAPLFISSVAACAAWQVSVVSNPAGPLCQTILTALSMLLSYAVLLLCFVPEEIAALLTYVRPFNRLRKAEVKPVAAASYTIRPPGYQHNNP